MIGDNNAVTNKITTKVMAMGDLHKEISRGLTVPSIQRDYKWGPGHDDDEELNSAAYVFLEDMIDFYTLRQEQDIYFTGTMIVFEEQDEDRTQLMDGQQRWTTITALMSVIRHILIENQGNHADLISDIESRFLVLKNGYQMLESKKKDDRRSILKMTRIKGNETFASVLPQSLKNNSVFKRNNITYKGTSINCVTEYYCDRLKENFMVRGTLSDVSSLIDFYNVMKDYVCLNYSHTKSPNLAYKMFVTANSRGTPLNNFDVFRGLVLAHCRIKQLGGEKDLQETLDAGDGLLQDYIQVSKKKDFGKAVDRVMSDVMTILEGKKIGIHHVMSRLEHRINSLSTLQDIQAFVGEIQEYIHQMLRIAQQKGKNGRVQHLRLNSYGFIQHIQYYAAARMYWGEKNQNIPPLLDVIESIVTRRLILHGKNISKLFYSIAPKHLASIRECGKDDEMQKKCIEKMRKDFSESNENPSDFEITEILKTQFFDIDSTGGKNKIIATLVCLETDTKFTAHEFQTKQGNPKVIAFMPKHNYYSPSKGFTYPTDFNKCQSVHGILGNCFLLNGLTTGKDISKFNEKETSHFDRKKFIQSKGKNINSTKEIILKASWGMKDIDDRTKLITEQLLKRFPESCGSSE